MMVEEFICGVEHGVQHVPGAHARRGRGDRRVRHARAEEDVRRRTCSTASGAARCASPSRTPAPTSARAHDDRDEARRRHATTSRARRSSSPAAITTSTENIIHLVLARTPDAPAGHQGPVAVHRPEDARRDGTPQRRHGRRHRAQDGHQRLGDRALNVRRERRLHRRARRHDASNKGMSPDVPPDERRAHRRRHPGPVARVARRTSTRSTTRRSASRAARSSTGRTRPRRACRSSSTPTCAACCST